MKTVLRMLIAIAVLNVAAVDGFGAPSDPIVLWPEGAPGAVGKEADDIPTLTPFFPETGKGAGAAVIVCPGGGYRGLADYEGKPVAEWLASIGVTGFVLKYRLAPKYHHPSMLLDAQRAIRTVRARAAEWGIDPAKIGILGFSAGGHLTASAGTHYDAGKPDAADPIERVSCRPDLMIPIYPVITMKEFGHAGSRKNLLGENPSEEMITLMPNELQVTKDTPPAFLVHGADDKGVPVENSLAFASALARAGVPCETHVYEHGPHGFGLGEKFPAVATWPGLCATWLKGRGFLVEEKGNGK